MKCIKWAKNLRGNVTNGFSLVMSMVPMLIFLGLMGSLFGRLRRGRTKARIPAAVAIRMVWVMSRDERVVRPVPYYCAVKIRQRLGWRILLTDPPKKGWRRLAFWG